MGIALGTLKGSSSGILKESPWRAVKGHPVGILMGIPSGILKGVTLLILKGLAWGILAEYTLPESARRQPLHILKESLFGNPSVPEVYSLRIPNRNPLRISEGGFLKETQSRIP